MYGKFLFHLPYPLISKSYALPGWQEEKEDNKKNSDKKNSDNKSKK